MRISDWSSDVCSSDLQFAVRLEQPDDPAADDADPRERDAQRRPGGGRGGIGGHAGLHEATEPRPVIASALSRSEEHTSELQSLMRISYAVFCLKKKKEPNK